MQILTGQLIAKLCQDSAEAMALYLEEGTAGKSPRARTLFWSTLVET
jgi:hypothetical protein